MESPSGIRNVKQISACECNLPRVLVTFNSGRQVCVHDDGSFIEWTGELG